MIRVGDRVKIVRVDPPGFSSEERLWLWAHGIEGTLTVINQSLPQIYYVKFDTLLDVDDHRWDGLWCYETRHVFENVILPKELFEI